LRVARYTVTVIQALGVYLSLMFRKCDPVRVRPTDRRG